MTVDFLNGDFEIEIVDCGLARLNQQSAISNRQSQSSINNPKIGNRHSAIRNKE
jgi:hypothetical protein